MMSTVVQARATFPITAVQINIVAHSSTLSNTVASSCTVNAEPVQCGSTAMLPIGSHMVRVRGVSSSGMSAEDSSIVVVQPLVERSRWVGFDADGNEHTPVGVWVVYGPDVGPKDSTQVGADGFVSVNTRYAGLANVPVEFRGNTVVRPSFGRTGVEFHATIPTVVVGSRVLNTPSCATTGPSRAIVIDLEQVYATSPGPKDTSSFFRRGLSPDSAWRYLVGSWPTLPQKVAFDSSLSATDSANFWAGADSLNRAFCATMIAPENKTQVLSSGGVEVRFVVNLISAGLVGGFSGDYARGSIVLDPVLMFSPWSQSWCNKSSIWHELFHTNGIGHTSAFESRMGPWGPDPLAPGGCSIRHNDVAYLLYMRRVREFERKYDTRFSLAWMHQGERRTKGLREEIVGYVGADGRLGSVSDPSQTVFFP